MKKLAKPFSLLILQYCIGIFLPNSLLGQVVYDGNATCYTELPASYGITLSNFTVPANNNAVIVVAISGDEATPHSGLSAVWNGLNLRKRGEYQNGGHRTSFWTLPIGDIATPTTSDVIVTWASNSSFQAPKSRQVIVASLHNADQTPVSSSNPPVIVGTSFDRFNDLTNSSLTLNRGESGDMFFNIISARIKDGTSGNFTPSSSQTIASDCLADGDIFDVRTVATFQPITQSATTVSWTLSNLNDQGPEFFDILGINHGTLIKQAENEIIDQDNDGIEDSADNCPSTPNPDQTDTDGDGIGDVCDDDADNDGCLDGDDPNPLVASGDLDADGIADDCDVCPNDAENDIDGDGICGDVDNCPTNFNPDQADTDGDGTGDACSPEWTVTQTGDSHIFVIDTENFTSDLGGGQTLQAGDQIGVFYEDNGEMKCAGSAEWTEENIAFTVYGDDLSTDSVKEGLSEGETLQWMVWDAATDGAQDVIATYGTEDTTGLFSEGGEFSTNGVSQLTSLNATSTQTITLQSGWNLISSYIEPSELDMAKVFEAIKDQVSIVKDEEGTSYITSSDINSIGDWDKLEGYQVRVLGDDPIELEITGAKIDPASTSIPLSSGWNLLPYHKETEQDIATALNPITNDLHIAKDIDGGIYMPALGINNIGNMQPGRAYWVKMKADATLSYTARMAGRPAQMHTAKLATSQYHINRRGIHNATLILDAKGLLTFGDEVGVFDKSENLVGSSVYEDHILTFAIWGDDPTTDEIDGLKEGAEFEIRVWNSATGTEKVVTFNANVNRYTMNSIVQAELLRTTNVPTLLESNNLKLYPNPTRSNATLSLSLTATASVETTIFDLSGKQVLHIQEKQMTAGTHTLSVQTAQLPNGLYHCRVLINGVIHNVPFSVVK